MTTENLCASSLSELFRFSATDEIKQYFEDSIKYDVNISARLFHLREELFKLQEHFHQHPELSNKEFQTAAYITHYLKKLSFESGVELNIQTNVANRTGVIATLTGANCGQCILLRADMDALPINEENDTEYKSEIKNVMHACGHDFHMAILLITAKMLCHKLVQQSMSGSVKFVFQPAEESGGGAKNMLMDTRANLLNTVDQVYGLHISSHLPFGRIALNNHNMLSGSGKVEIRLQSKNGGHAAFPQDTTDLIVVSANLIQQIQSIVSRNIDPLEMGIITIATIHCGTKNNVIADELTMSGTLRWYNPAIGRLLKSRLETICAALKNTFDLASVELKFADYSYPATINSQIGFENVCRAARQIVGEVGLESDMKPVSASEDFSEFLVAKPGAFYLLGADVQQVDEQNGAKLAFPHHTKLFRVDQRAALIGCQVMTQLILDLLVFNNNNNDESHPKYQPPSKL